MKEKFQNEKGDKITIEFKVENHYGIIYEPANDEKKLDLDIMGDGASNFVEEFLESKGIKEIL